MGRIDEIIGGSLDEKRSDFRYRSAPRSSKELRSASEEPMDLEQKDWWQ